MFANQRGGHFKSDSRHGWLHSRNRTITKQKDTNPNNSPELITKNAYMNLRLNS